MPQWSDAHRADLSSFVLDDPQGKVLPSYLKNLGVHLVAERDELMAELESIERNAEHIKHVIGVQQESARVSAFVQATDIAALVDDAIGIATIDRAGVDIVRDFARLPPIVIAKHKVLQILINLVSNAKHALDATEMPHVAAARSPRFELRWAGCDLSHRQRNRNLARKQQERQKPQR